MVLCEVFLFLQHVKSQISKCNMFSITYTVSSSEDTEKPLHINTESDQRSRAERTCFRLLWLVEPFPLGTR